MCFPCDRPVECCPGACGALKSLSPMKSHLQRTACSFWSGALLRHSCHASKRVMCEDHDRRLAAAREEADARQQPDHGVQLKKSRKLALWSLQQLSFTDTPSGFLRCLGPFWVDISIVQGVCQGGLPLGPSFGPRDFNFKAPPPPPPQGGQESPCHPVPPPAFPCCHPVPQSPFSLLKRSIMQRYACNFRT